MLVRAVSNPATWLDRTDQDELHKNRRNAMLYELEQQQRSAAEKVVPWFLKNMPEAYFERVPVELQKVHLRAIAGNTQVCNGGVIPRLTVTDDNSITVLLPEKRKSDDSLETLLTNFNRSRSHIVQRVLQSVQLFTSEDESLHMNIFTFEPEAGSSAQRQKPIFEEAQMLFDRVKGTETPLVELKMDAANSKHGTVFIAAPNVIKTLALMRATRYLSMHGCTMKSAEVVSIIDESNSLGTDNVPAEVCLMKLEMDFTFNDSDQYDKKPLPGVEQMCNELQHGLKWLNERDFELSSKYRQISLTQAEVINALASLQHTRLGLHDPYSFTATNISLMIERQQLLPHVIAIADLFLERFNPESPMETAKFQEKLEALTLAIGRTVNDETELSLLSGMLDAVKATRRTNLYLPNRYALALRLDPEHLGHGTVGADMPYGSFFVYGRRFQAFHVRFRDIARGGLRVVAPRTKDQHAAESTRTYNEAYSLAYAQQLKNKDIPEGGAKAAVLLEPDDSDNYIPTLFGQSFMIRKVVRAFTESILDLTSGDARVVDLLGKDELIYLGPDENIVPQDIDWIINRAVQRNYVMPQALMSSKPKNGINHKQFGVTSEGVAVNLEVALKQTGKHPSQTGKAFTVKLTGGTDGDVAGNMLRLLNEQYGDDVKVVGLADGTASLEDSDGLDMQELMRMVSASLPLSAFTTSRLGPNGFLALSNTLEGSQLRDTMHNRVAADAFVPAGGRPGTVNIRNYKDYLSGPNGTPSSSLIVEGANLFITPEARQALFEEADVVIVKDSSANKCGVITSSYEILASMLVSPEEFLEIKSDLVPDVLAQLKRLARVEAEMLFRELKSDPNTSLPKQSERVSMAINRVHDAITANLQKTISVKDGSVDWSQVVASIGERKDVKLTLGEVLELVAKEHVPKALLNKVGTETLRQRVPWPYLQNLIACNLATKLVYSEGLEFAEKLPQDDSRIATTAYRYVAQSQMLEKLVDAVSQSGLPMSDDIIHIIKNSGAAMLSRP